METYFHFGVIFGAKIGFFCDFFSKFAHFYINNTAW
jgi:hypothetical protein